MTGRIISHRNISFRGLSSFYRIKQSCPNRACSGSRLQADELFGGNSYANSEEPGQATQIAVSDQAEYSLLSLCTFKSFLP